MSRDAIVAEARSWIGTPYRHQASLKGVGTDCLGLLRGVWRGVIGAEPEAVPPYGDQDRDELLLAAAQRNLRAIGSFEFCGGDVLLFR
jgi:NlpC/P60 family putative phage cell wall peptidase